MISEHEETLSRIANALYKDEITLEDIANALEDYLSSAQAMHNAHQLPNAQENVVQLSDHRFDTESDAIELADIARLVGLIAKLRA